MSKVPQSIRKAFVCLIVALSLSSIVGTAFELNFFPTSYFWGFENYGYLSFDPAVNFTSAPHLGVPYDSSLVGYWNMNEGSGTVANDSSGNGNNGNVTDASWVTGKYGEALSFNGENSSIQCGPLNITGSYTVSAWIKASTNGNAGLVSILCNYQSPLNGIGLFLNNGLAVLRLYYGTGYADVAGTVDLRDGTWHFLTGTWNTQTMVGSVYVDGTLVSSTTLSKSVTTSSLNTFIGDYSGANWFKGDIDEVRVYNRALSTAEVAASYDQSDPLSYANYYYFTDPTTSNTMLIHVDNPNAGSNNVALVTCTNFFAGNKLSFQTNNSATINVWTNLGQPVFTTGVWNSQNYTTTLTLNDTSTAELNWNTYTITTYTDAHAVVSPSNMTVAYGESLALSFSAMHGYNFKVKVDGTPKGQISSYTFNNIRAPHTVNITSTLMRPFPVETLIAIAATAIIITGFAFAFKKGYKIIKVVDEENPQEPSGDFTI